MGTKIKLPEGFGGLSIDGQDVPLTADAEGCVDVDGVLADVLVSHGGVRVAELEAEAAATEAEVDAATAKIRSKRKS